MRERRPTFDFNGMRISGQQMSVYGDVYDNAHPKATITDMGRGTAQGAAMKFITVALLGSQSGIDWTDASLTSTIGTLSPPRE